MSLNLPVDALQGGGLCRKPAPVPAPAAPDHRAGEAVPCDGALQPSNGDERLRGCSASQGEWGCGSMGCSMHGVFGRLGPEDG